MPAPQKLDLYARHKEEYAASTEPTIVQVKPARYLAIQGRGEPGGEAFQAAVGALYNVAFTVKMARKAAGRDYAVSKLEGLWWGKGKDGKLIDQPKTSWQWQLLIRVPDWIQAKEVAQTADTLVKKGKSQDVRNVELLLLNEGRSVQMLHVGPYDDEARTIARMESFATGQRLAFHGRHHEIYLSDPRRIQPAKLRTILRRPVK
jgi:hypothetical protein